MTVQLTQKELMYLSDCLEMEQNQVTKFSDAAAQASNPQLRSTLQGLAQMHQGHFNLLKKHIEG